MSRDYRDYIAIIGYRLRLYIGILWKRKWKLPVMQNQMEHEMQHEMETGGRKDSNSIRVTWGNNGDNRK